MERCPCSTWARTSGIVPWTSHHPSCGQFEGEARALVLELLALVEDGLEPGVREIVPGSAGEATYVRACRARAGL